MSSSIGFSLCGMACVIHRLKPVLQRAEKFVEFVGGVEVGFEFAGAEAFAEIVEAAGEEIKRRGEHFPISKNDVAPGGVGTASEAKRVAQAGA